MIWVWIVLQGLTLLGVVNYWRHLPLDRREERPDGVVVILSVRDDWDGGAPLMARLTAQSAAGLAASQYAAGLIDFRRDPVYLC